MYKYVQNYSAMVGKKLVNSQLFTCHHMSTFSKIYPDLPYYRWHKVNKIDMYLLIYPNMNGKKLVKYKILTYDGN